MNSNQLQVKLPNDEDKQKHINKVVKDFYRTHIDYRGIYNNSFYLKGTRCKVYNYKLMMELTYNGRLISLYFKPTNTLYETYQIKDYVPKPTHIKLFRQFVKADKIYTYRRIEK